MKVAYVILVLSLTAFASARNLLAPSPAPAPGPSSCPPKQSPAASCVVTATTFQTQCTSFISNLQAKTGGQVTATTDPQINALVQQLQGANMMPSAACCSTAVDLFKNACACDASVQAVAKAVQNLSPSQFQTVGKVFLVACGQQTCLDTCNLASA